MGRGKNALTAPYAEAASQKMSQKEVHYKLGAPSRRCGVCMMYVPPNSCTAVNGYIRADGVCDLFERA